MIFTFNKWYLLFINFNQHYIFFYSVFNIVMKIMQFLISLSRFSFYTLGWNRVSSLSLNHPFPLSTSSPTSQCLFLAFIHLWFLLKPSSLLRTSLAHWRKKLLLFFRMWKVAFSLLPIDTLVMTPTSPGETPAPLRWDWCENRLVQSLSLSPLSSSSFKYKK